ncbi:polysaccharide deacetylase family protein [Pelotomaculum isophthalicicum JI]|uniref:Polysaccharide deacetylase family protein n=1 Tax=Pelotomaculum isophthalicicum JI TaxID=947010 RepID=A0A9X4H264_9FIRM|nr:polysaccharide deacetylase family protein [Pelotomaculum isophthalicicum]MDF9408625.1 polysaccharide deacetylase family protein [Pelotomaculum isophthalicicum JI]
MEPYFAKILLIILIVYIVAPTVLTRFGQVGVISRATKGKGTVVLTFDDGPDPRYTPQILDILNRHQVKASFFITGAKAKLYPDLIKQITSAGHEIGNHGFRHKAAWLLGPRATITEITDTNRVLEELTGKKPIYFRPCWGLYNLSSLWYYWSRGLKVVLWTYMSWDWAKHATPESITRRVLNKLRDGVILIFHDSDSAPGAAPGGPDRVIAALPQILEGITLRGLRVAPLEEIMAGKNNGSAAKRMVIFLWSFVDRIIRLLSGIKDIKDDQSFIWRLALRRYHGQEWLMKDGSLLKKGDYYIEIHINNDLLLKLLGEHSSTERIAVIAMREVRHSLPKLARLMKDDKRYGKAKLLLGITLLHRGTVRLGFTTYELKPGLFRMFTGWYENLLLSLFHPGGFKNSKTYREKLSPKYVVMTRQELMRRYPPAGIPETVAPR